MKHDNDLGADGFCHLTGAEVLTVGVHRFMAVVGGSFSPLALLDDLGGMFESQVSQHVGGGPVIRDQVRPTEQTLHRLRGDRFKEAPDDTSFTDHVYR